MHSIRTRITAITAGVIVLAMLIATVFGVVAIKDIGKHSAEQTLLLLCETGQKNLNPRGRRHRWRRNASRA